MGMRKKPKLKVEFEKAESSQLTAYSEREKVRNPVAEQARKGPIRMKEQARGFRIEKRDA